MFKSAQKDQQNNSWKPSLTKYKRIIKLSPKSPFAQKAHIEVGKYYKYNREWDNAIAEYSEAIAIAPDSRYAHDAKTSEAAIYYFQQDFPRALKTFKGVLSETKDWDQIKYCTYWIKELKRKLSFPANKSFSCGKEALKIAFEILGIKSGREEIAKLLKTEDKFIPIVDLTRVAQEKGLKPKVVKVAPENLQHLTTPFIALVNPDHYIVVEEVKSGKIKFIDPGVRRNSQTTSLAKFLPGFKGYALVFLKETELAKTFLKTPTESELKDLKGGICDCCPPANLGSPAGNNNVEFDGNPPGCPGMPSWLVNTVTLNLVIQDIDFSYNSRGMPIEFVRTFNADDPREGIFGRSWTFNYNISLVENPDTSIDVRRGDGRIDHFFFNGVRYQGPSGVYDTLIKNGNGTYTLKIKKDKTTQQFSAQGRLTSIHDRNSNAITFAYDGEGKLTHITDPNDKITVLAYGANLKVERITLPDGRFVRFFYDANNNLIQTIDMLSATSSFTYDAASYMTSMTTPHKGTVSFEYVIGEEGYSLSAVTDAFNNRRVYSPYAFGEYDSVKITDSRGNTTYYQSTFDGYTQGVISAQGNTVNFGYDDFGNRNQIIDALSNATNLVYDAKGNITSITDPLNNDVTLGYDTNNNLIQSIDPKNNTFNFTYDANSNLLETRDPDGQITTFNYNSYGQLTRIIDAKNQTTDFTYDEEGNLIKMTDPLGKFTSYTHDTLGRVLTLTDPKNQLFTYQYDGVDHLTKVTYPDASTIDYIYNCCNLIQINDKYGALNFNYDALGRLTGFTDYNSQAISYGYDSEGNLISLTYPGNKIVNYDYDKDGRLIKVTDWLNNITEYRYDPRGNLFLSSSPGLITLYKYDEANRLSKLLNYNTFNFNLTSAFEYTLDPSGNRTNIKKYMPLNTPSLNLGTTSYSYNSDNQLMTATKQSFEYDNNGNTTRRIQPAGTTNFTYDADNRLIQYSQPGQANLNFLYDSLGNRIQKAQGATVTKYIVDPNSSLPSVLAEADASGNIHSYYVYGLGLISKIQGNNAYYYQYDGIGSTVAMTDVTGAIVNQYAYDDFGNLADNSSETIANPFKYVGKFGVATDAPDLLYMRARYYSPSLGRFINKDPIGLSGGLNLYAYVGNNVIQLTDPSGLGGAGGGWIIKATAKFEWYDIISWIFLNTNYCGSTKKGPGPPTSSIDCGCQGHDTCIKNLNAHWWQFWKKDVNECHFILMKEWFIVIKERVNK